MDDRGAHTGLIGVGFLFGLISLFLLVLCLKQTGHSAAAAGSGLAGSALLAGVTARFLLRRWRTAPDAAAFDEDGDVPFSFAVCLLASIALAAGLARVAGINLSRIAPLLAMLLPAAAIPARKFVRSLRRSR
jgi:hypothetical protein